MDDWEDDFGSAPAQGGATDPLVDQEYARLETRYTDAGYREGITDGKLATLQQGFDQSFAASVPASRQLGQLRGRASALLVVAQQSSSSASHVNSPNNLVDEIRALVYDLAHVRRDDILPRDNERLEHEREEHGYDDRFELDATETREMEGLEAALEGLTGATEQQPPVPLLRERALLDSLDARIRMLEIRVAAAASQ